jgi:hypothetical protein
MVLQKSVYPGLLYRPQVVISDKPRWDEHWSERNYLLSVAKNLERPAFHQADQDAMRIRFLTRTSFRNDNFYLKRFRYTGALKEEKMNR